MATRDKTSQFLERKRAFKQRQRRLSSKVGDNKPLVLESGESSTWNTLRDSLPPVWVDTLDELKQNMQIIDKKLQELEQKHKNRMLVTFDEKEAELDRDIEILSQEVTRLFRVTEAKLKKIASTGVSENASSTELNVRKNVQRSIAARLQEQSMTFRKSQKLYLEKLEKSRQNARGGNSIFGDYNEDEDQGFNLNQKMRMENSAALAEEREREIEKIAKSIEELAQIFKELAVLVIDQGTVLDRIDYNMEMAVERTKQGMVELEKANKYQKSARPLKCIILLLFLIGVEVIILIMKAKK